MTTAAAVYPIPVVSETNSSIQKSDEEIRSSEIGKNIFDLIIVFYLVLIVVIAIKGLRYLKK